MNTYLVAGAAPVDFDPSSEVEEIIQNVRTILGTVRGTVPLDRKFGVDSKIVDIPINRAKASLQSDIIETVAKYEPRAQVLGVTFADSDAMTGRLQPAVRIRILTT